MVLENCEWRLWSNKKGLEHGIAVISMMHISFASNSTDWDFLKNKETNVFWFKSADWELWRPSRRLTSQYVQHRSLMVEKLMLALQYDEDCLAKKLDEVSMLILDLAITVTLIEASPFKRLGRSQLDYDLLKKTVVKNVGFMLSFDHVIATDFHRWYSH